jgi:hypothetical protein
VCHDHALLQVLETIDFRHPPDGGQLLGFRVGSATDSLISGRGLAVFTLIRVFLFVTAFTGKILIFSFIQTKVKYLGRGRGSSIGISGGGVYG